MCTNFMVGFMLFTDCRVTFGLDSHGSVIFLGILCNSPDTKLEVFPWLALFVYVAGQPLGGQHSNGSDLHILFLSLRR